MPKKRKTNKKELAGSRVKLTFRRHFMPPLVGLIVAILIFGFFNSQLLSGKIAYHFYERNVDVAALDRQITSSAIDKNAPPRLLISAIKVEAPVIFGLTKTDEATFQKALRGGVVHYPNTALPGQAGNVVIFGHSSGQWWAPGDYKFIFTRLDKLKTNDQIIIESAGTRYIYKVYESFVVLPTDVEVLKQSSEYDLTLITCTPVGSNSKRLIIKARQVVPKPEIKAPAATGSQPAISQQTSNLPSNSSSFWDDFLELF